jgi:hypothetical protein
MSPQPRPTALITQQKLVVDVPPLPYHSLVSTDGAKPLSAILLLPVTPTIPGHGKVLSRISSGLFMALVVLVIAGCIPGSYSLLNHFGAIDTRSGPRVTLTVTRGKVGSNR